VSVDDLTPVDQSITVKRHQIPVAYTLAGAIVLVVFFTWAPWILPAWTSRSDEFLHPRDHGDDVEPARRVRRDGLDRSAGLHRLGAYATLYFAIKGMDPFVAFRSR